MRKSTAALAIGLAVLGCRSDGDGPDHAHEGEFDEAWLLDVAATYDVYADVGLLASETITDEAGCVRPKWQNTVVFAYHPETLQGMGVHFEDITYPVDQYEEDRARMVMYDLSDTGEYEIAGLEWYVETADGESLGDHPTLFGVPLDGIMEGHTPTQGMHYDIHAWIWKPSEENLYGYFNEFNPGMDTPAWWLEAEPAIFNALGYHDPTLAASQGYTSDEVCMTAAEGHYGVKQVNADLVGQLDPFAPDTILTDINGLLLGVQWTSPDDGNGPPTLFQQTFSGPDADGNYTLRMWMGTRTNPLGFFAPAFPYPLCDEEAIPVECLGGP